MAKYKCSICGYETEQEELAEDFCCALCGVGKDKFKKVEE